MGMQDRDYYKDWRREQDKKPSRKLWPQRRKKLDLSAYGFDRGMHPVLVAIIWACIIIALTAAFKFFR